MLHFVHGMNYIKYWSQLENILHVPFFIRSKNAPIMMNMYVCVCFFFT